MTFAVLFPGQGAQARGMGGDVFGSYPGLTRFACDLLGYDLVALCRDDPDGRLARTEYTQPALFVVNALRTFERERREARRADYYLGHSLGEYNALLAAGVFDFETGLRLVKRRGELMAAASAGGMTAVLDLPPESLLGLLQQDGVDGIDLAVLNTGTQSVVAGPAEALSAAHEALKRRGVRHVPLRVGGPFHSRYMHPARTEFETYLREFTFAEPHTPVVANATGLPYVTSETVRTLCDQIVRPVRWSDSIRHLLGQGSPLEYEELGGRFLSKMVKEIALPLQGREISHA
ncbi:acyltransferase domain-containing protein [Streptomyces paludis]|uniref:Malonyl CoA-acyl carrier protein transacylase n=1 Tax=Streptomyces paludis TaxID=2282738 RepID=A0A345HZ31_9ACTN|nr:acyltransferase domain-containing protein [Streptomyces paludis]AXG81955.1 acyltransferase domain-containing protein [Streptomyces paludis]